MNFDLSSTPVSYTPATHTIAATFDQTPSTAFASTPLIIGLIIALVLCIAFIIAAIIFFMPARDKAQRTRVSVHNDDSTYKKQVREIEDSYTRGDITQQDTFRELASIARHFASDRLGVDVTAHTLSDIAQSSKLQSSRRTDAHGIDLLRSTIEALYPPEFAYAATQSQNSHVTVLEACRWVTALIERWDD